MDNLPWFFTLFLSLLLVIIIKTKISNKNLPPGPWKLPLIGNLHHLVGYGLLHHRLRDLATKYGPIMHIQLGPITSTVVSSPELAEEVMKTQDLVFAARPSTATHTIITYNARDIFASPYGPYLANLKKICSLELFNTKRIQSFRSVREEEVSQLVRFVTESAGAPVNLSKMIEALVYCIISRSAFGRPMNLEDAFTPTIRKVVTLFDGFQYFDLFPHAANVVCGFTKKVDKLQREVDAILEEIIQDHREKKKSENSDTPDLVDVLLGLQDHGKLDLPLAIQDIKAVLFDVFVGGVHTTTTALEWVMAEMVRNPKVMKKAQEEVRRVYHGKGKVDETDLQNLTYLNLVIKETLRLHPPAPLLVPRVAQEETKIRGYKIPKKSVMVVNGWAIARDPKHWIEPEKFYPERFLGSEVNYKGTCFEYLPFGAGRRICPGMLYASAVVQIVLSSLLYHFNWMAPNGIKNEDLDMSETFGVVARRKNELCLVPTLEYPQ